MLPALLPASVVLASVGPLEDTLALSLVIYVASTVLAAVLPGEVPLPVLLVVLPLTVVLASVAPLVDPVALHLVLHEVTLEGALVRPDELPATMLLPLAVVASEDGPVRPHLLAEAVVLVIDPVAVVVCSIDMRVGALAVGAVLRPVAHVDVAVTVDDPPEPLLVIVEEVAIVPRTVRPNLRTTSMALTAITPLADILDLRGQDHLFLALHTQTGILQHLLTGRVTPFKVTNFCQFLLHNLTIVVRSILTVLARVSGSQI